MYIESQDELVSFVQRAASSSLLAIDTEFLREKTYYAKLCLLQIATDDEVVIIDPLAVSDITALAPLLVDERIVKIFHAGHQDLELLYRNVGVLPSPVFDTQIAAALLGHTQQIGYGSLVGALCGVRIKKADSFTDWSHRPLSDSQIQYAGEDVVYLPKIYATMKRRLEEKGRLEWLRNDFAELSDPSRYEVDERERFRRLKHVSSLSRCQMAAAREMAAWREAAARERNIPRKWVLSDEQIVEACKREPRTIDDLFMVRGMRERLNVRDARTIISRVASAMNAPASTWPDSGNPSKSEPNVDMQVDLMMAIVRMRARENDIAIPTLASHDDLTKIARGYCDDVEILRGWRRELIGAELLDLLNGRIALSVENGSVRVDRF
ncbi:MAG: ribonuclease D [Berryella intestinalis]|uniref:ribonuclease D n=1 Tax=Berryella intestinalis TaxID=1531429 RepID=UPI002A4F1307|nr:ribonuclease D [Berryella intestinalis]MDD7368945.1 ribonuclease D [Berryella intestinalis]MDY3129995.1 ribonuclease D [Berryella intestinalis]